jgi:hypothetical protein
MNLIGILMYFSIIYRETFFDLSVKNQFDFLNAEYRTGAMIFICSYREDDWIL